MIIIASRQEKELVDLLHAAGGTFEIEFVDAAS